MIAQCGALQAEQCDDVSIVVAYNEMVYTLGLYYEYIQRLWYKNVSA